MTINIGDLSIMEGYVNPLNGKTGTAIYNYFTQQLLFLRKEDMEDLYNYMSQKLPDEEKNASSTKDIQ